MFIQILFEVNSIRNLTKLVLRDFRGFTKRNIIVSPDLRFPTVGSDRTKLTVCHFWFHTCDTVKTIIEIF